MEDLTVKVELESHSVGLEIDNVRYNFDLVLTGEEESLLSFYEGSLVGEKRNLKRRILKYLDKSKLKYYENLVYSEREPLSKEIGNIKINKDLEIIEENLK